MSVLTVTKCLRFDRARACVGRGEAHRPVELAKRSQLIAIKKVDNMVKMNGGKLPGGVVIALSVPQILAVASGCRGGWRLTAGLDIS
jgi:hypothetical protein